jgi:DNA-binding NarL/FixJ family response regulator
MSNQEIAVELGLSMATVRTHLEHIFDRLDVSNRTAAVAKALPPRPKKSPPTTESERLRRTR